MTPLSTERTVLRSFEPNDADAIFTYASDPEATRYMAWVCHQSIQEASDFILQSLRSAREGTAWHYAIVLKDTQALIGSAGFDLHDDSAFLGYILNKDYHGQGIATEVSQRLIEHASQIPGIKRITSCCHIHNSASRRVLEKVGLIITNRDPAPHNFPNLDAHQQEAYFFELVFPD